MRELLARGAAVDVAENDGATPLFIASQKNHFEVMRELLQRGAAVDAAMNNGATPLFIATARGHAAVAALIRAALARARRVRV